MKPPTDLEPGVIGPGATTASTFFHQRAVMFSGFSSAMIAKRIEKASADRFAKNATVGKKGFEWVLAGGQGESTGGIGSDLLTSR